MDYEQKYKEVLELARDYYKTNSKLNKADENVILEDIFPELAESEDKRVREDILAFVKREGQHIDKYKWHKWIAWLEKQGKQKPTTIDIDKMVDDYANNKERGNEEFGKPVSCMIRAYRQGLKDAIGKVVLKPTWSEEDEKNLDITIAYLKDAKEFKKTAEDCIDWFKSLKQRIGG